MSEEIQKWLFDIQQSILEIDAYFESSRML